MKNKDDFKLEIPVVFGGGAPAISTYRYQQQAIERNRLQNQQMNNFPVQRLKVLGLNVVAPFLAASLFHSQVT